METRIVGPSIAFNVDAILHSMHRANLRWIRNAVSIIVLRRPSSVEHLQPYITKSIRIIHTRTRVVDVVHVYFEVCVNVKKPSANKNNRKKKKKKKRGQKLMCYASGVHRSASQHHANTGNQQHH